MKNLRVFVCLFVFSCIALASQEDIKLTSEVKAEIKFDNNHKNGIWVEVKLTNLTNHVACLNSASIGLDSYINGSIFHVRRNNIDLKYTDVDGDRRFVDRGLIRLLPDASVSSSIDISEFYNFSLPGEYEIQFAYISTELCPELTLFPLKSNIIIFRKS